MGWALIILIHENYSFPGNIQKNSYTQKIKSPYLQIIEIQNKPLNLVIIFNFYMPSHQEDLILIFVFKENIYFTMSTHQTRTTILLGDFSRDLKLIGRHSNQTWNPLNLKDIKWADFKTLLQLIRLFTNASYIRQGREK
jgi:hypothetical protein